MSINNREDANKYYHLINGLVDDYIETWKIRPSNLKRYLQPGTERFSKFLERNKLSDIKGTDIILRDVIEDRYNMEKDGIVTFESFNILESNEFKIQSIKSCLYKGINKATIEMEKVLADYFDTNLGSVSVEDSDKHKFKIDDWGGEGLKVVIYSSEDIELIKYNIVEHLYEEVSKKEIELVEGMSISLESLIDFQNFSNKVSGKLTTEENCQLITKTLGDGWELRGNISWNGMDFFIWVK